MKEITELVKFLNSKSIIVDEEILNYLTDMCIKICNESYTKGEIDSERLRIKQILGL